MEMKMRLPCPGRESTSMRPPSERRRSLMLKRPNPDASSMSSGWMREISKPTPLSSTKSVTKS